MDEALEELTRILIKQDFKDKEAGKVECIKISKVNLIRLCIKLVKLIK